MDDSDEEYQYEEVPVDDDFVSHGKIDLLTITCMVLELIIFMFGEFCHM